MLSRTDVKKYFNFIKENIPKECNCKIEIVGNYYNNELKVLTEGKILICENDNKLGDHNNFVIKVLLQIPKVKIASYGNNFVTMIFDESKIIKVFICSPDTYVTFKFFLNSSAHYIEMFQSKLAYKGWGLTPYALLNPNKEKIELSSDKDIYKSIEEDYISVKERLKYPPN